MKSNNWLRNEKYWIFQIVMSIFLLICIIGTSICDLWSSEPSIILQLLCLGCFITSGITLKNEIMGLLNQLKRQKEKSEEVSDIVDPNIPL